MNQLFHPELFAGLPREEETFQINLAVVGVNGVQPLGGKSAFEGNNCFIQAFTKRVVDGRGPPNSCFAERAWMRENIDGLHLMLFHALNQALNPKVVHRNGLALIPVMRVVVV